MAKKKTLLKFNPDTMRVSDVKDAAKALRNLLGRLEMTREVLSASNMDKEAQEAKLAKDMYLQIIQLEEFWTTDEDEAGD